MSAEITGRPSGLHDGAGQLPGLSSSGHSSAGTAGSGASGPAPSGLPYSGMPLDADLDGATELMRLLADRTRLSILALLAQGELSVGDIASRLERANTGVSQHLAKLRMGRLVTTRRTGTTIYYALANEHVAGLVANILHQSEHSLYDVPPHHLPPL